MSFNPRWVYSACRILFAFACMCVYALCVDTHDITCVYGLQNTFVESVLAFDLYMGSRDQTQVDRSIKQVIIVA